MKGYKAFNSDLTCRGFQFEIGKEYKHEGEIKPCQSGFHFCKSVADCYKFYPMSTDTRICKVEALGEVETDDDVKFVTDYIKIVSEVKKPKEKSNTNQSNNGFCNSGDWNSGNCNSGNRNSGDCNSGDWNSGDWNSGDCNSGDWNSGDWNSGNRNSGNCNSGDWNSGNWNSGIFNTDKKPKINMFDAPSDWTMNDWYQSGAYNVLLNMPYTHSNFIWANNMTDEEKEKHPEHKTIGGYVKVIVVTAKDRQKWWDNLDVDKDKVFRSLPNFDEKKFCECIGIDRW